MKLQYTTECALRMMVYLAEKNKLVSSRELEEKISFPQQTIFSAGRVLKAGGYVATVSGPFGGYILKKTPEEITVEKILALFKDSLSISCDEEFEKRAPTAALRNFINIMKEFECSTIQAMDSLLLSDFTNEPEKP